MNLRKLGKTNRMVSEIGLGTWQLGTRWGDPFNEAEAMKILEASYDSGTISLTRRTFTTTATAKRLSESS